jgi:hypothetical protein
MRKQKRNQAQSDRIPRFDSSSLSLFQNQSSKFLDLEVTSLLRIQVHGYVPQNVEF